MLLVFFKQSKTINIGNDIIYYNKRTKPYPHTKKERGKKLLEQYGFVLEDTEDGFWITGVKE